MSPLQKHLVSFFFKYEFRKRNKGKVYNYLLSWFFFLFFQLFNCIYFYILATGLAVDASQEMITLGLCNIIGSCFKSMPTCGAFTRSAVSHASGVKVLRNLQYH